MFAYGRHIWLSMIMIEAKQMAIHPYTFRLDADVMLACTFGDIHIGAFDAADYYNKHGKTIIDV